ncbi:MAG: hypothetical protein E7212_02480 [Clostridium sartagoforme]|nr:hypothetical protein [Clostridium sartagoforme]
MSQIKISDKIKVVCPQATLGCLRASVKVKNSSDELLELLNESSNDIKKIPLEDISSLPKIKDAREVYKKLGKAPSKYRVSSEALMRRIVQGKGLYQVNNIVEINNIISLKSHFPVGSYNSEKIEFPIALTVGEEGQSYKGIGKEAINISNLPVLSDNIGTFGCPTSDSERCMITNDVKEIVMCIYSFTGEDKLHDYLNTAKELLETYADGKDVYIEIIK